VQIPSSIEEMVVPSLEVGPGRRASGRVRMLRFVAVGAINTAIDLMILNALILLSGRGRSGIYYTLFKVVSFVCAAANSYFMNGRWTFSVPSARLVKTTKAAQFLLVSLCGLVVNATTASYVVTFVHPLRGMGALWPTFAALVGTGCGLAFNFLGYSHFVFLRERR